LRKAEYDTIRGLERRNAGLFKLAVILGAVGLVLTLVGMGTILTIIGGVSILAGIAPFFYGMLWMIKLQQEPTVVIYCPYCASKNDVFKSRKEFACDICARRIAVSPSGEPIPMEPIEEDD